jgi:rhamnosyltransferase
MRFSAGFTLFYPTKDEITIILNYTKVFDKVYIFDNTDNIDLQRVNQMSFKDNKTIKYTASTQNLGLSIALNDICQTSIIDGFDYVCLFDQDSFISHTDIIKIFDLIANNVDRSIGVFCPKIIYNKEVNQSYLKCGLENSISEIKWAITSGSFINLDVFGITSGFDEKYFIDRLDYDYCFYLKKKGYKIIQIDDAYLFQQLGEKKVFFGINISEHNAIRHYYIFRNRLYFYLFKEFSIFNVFKLTAISFKHFLTVLLETNRLYKIKILWKSIKDYSTKNMGKFS